MNNSNGNGTPASEREIAASISCVLKEEQGRTLHDIAGEIDHPRIEKDTDQRQDPKSSAGNIQRILILGAGTMGRQIACVCALHGFPVTLYDVSSDALKSAARKIQASARRMKLYAPPRDPAAVASALARIHYTTDPVKAALGVHLISESIPESLRLKKQVFGQFHALCPAETLFTTNTSSLLPSQIACATGRPERFCCLHFHDVFRTRMVDVMPHPGTAPQTVAAVEAFAKRIGQHPIVLQKEHSGYVFNSMLMALLQAALTLAANEVASVADIDRAFMDVMRTKVGPFGIIDSIGLDTAWKITDALERCESKTGESLKSALLKTYIDRGMLGVKSGEGFYSYPSPLFSSADFLLPSKSMRNPVPPDTQWRYRPESKTPQTR